MYDHFRFIANSLDDTEAFARRVAKILRPGDLICLDGEMGVGKTTFVQGLARGLGSVAQVSSPTFALIQEYSDSRIPLVHGDAYRLRSAADLADVFSVDEALGEGAVVVMEWASRVVEALPDEYLAISILAMERGTRIFNLWGVGVRWENLPEDWNDVSEEAGTE